jgi:hypothetical protein
MANDTHFPLEKIQHVLDDFLLFVDVVPHHVDRADHELLY